MKKSELTQLTQIIEVLVAKEVRKQLPAIIAETFQNMMGKKTIVTEQKQPSKTSLKAQLDELDEEVTPDDFKASLKELFNGPPITKQPEMSQPTRAPRHFTNNPVLNQILNETTPDLRARERMMGAAAFQGGYSPTLDMIPGFDPRQAVMADMGTVEEPSFSKNMPTMPGASSIPISRPPVLMEGQESTHAPMEAVPQGLSVLDLAREVPAPAVQHALTRNYSQMMKLIDKKKGKI
jgi:hypothetical protein